MSDHIIHVVIELGSWGSNNPDPDRALEIVRKDIQRMIGDEYDMDEIGDTGLHVEGLTAI